MSHKLSGKAVDDVLVEWWGPHTDRNYFAAAAPRLLVVLRGTGTVIIEENTTLEIVGTNNSNAVGSVPIRGGKVLPTRDAGDWGPLATVTQASSSPTPQVVAVAASPTAKGLRARVSAVGEGAIEIVSDWN